MSNYYFAIVGATDNPLYETEIVPSSRSSAFIDSNRVKKLRHLQTKKTEKLEYHFFLATR